MTIEVRHVYRSRDLAGTPVRNTEGTDLGRLGEVVVDLEHDALAYAAISAGGFLGMGAKFVAVPWKALTLKHDVNEMYFLLDIEPDVLAKLPGFNKRDWPDVADPDWRAEIDKLYVPAPFLESKE